MFHAPSLFFGFWTSVVLLFRSEIFTALPSPGFLTCTSPSDLFLNPQALPGNTRALVKSTALGPAWQLTRPRTGFPCLFKPTVSSELLPCLYEEVPQTQELFEDRVASSWPYIEEPDMGPGAHHALSQRTDGEGCLTWGHPKSHTSLRLPLLLVWWFPSQPPPLLCLSPLPPPKRGLWICTWNVVQCPASLLFFLFSLSLPPFIPSLFRLFCLFSHLT